MKQKRNFALFILAVGTYKFIIKYILLFIIKLIYFIIILYYKGPSQYDSQESALKTPVIQKINKSVLPTILSVHMK